jgi:hypothetical protein
MLCGLIPKELAIADCGFGVLVDGDDDRLNVMVTMSGTCNVLSSPRVVYYRGEQLVDHIGRTPKGLDSRVWV